MKLNFLNAKGPARTTRGGAGFTLIELLVVIAIIGILSAIVLTSLGTARNKAKNASAISSLSAMRSEAELLVDSSGNYPTTLCTVGLLRLMNAIDAQVGAANTECYTTASGSAWGAAADLLGSPAVHYCVDSTGYSGTSTVAASTEIDSGTSDAVCNNT